MTLRHLRIFQMVCEEENITRAAQRLYMTQPAVTHAIKELEEALQLSLFDRISRRLYLNETGKAVRKKVLLILEQYDDLIKHTSDILETTQIRIGSSITLANDMLAPLLKQFAILHPDTPYEVHINNADEILSMLKQKELDAAFLEGSISSSDTLIKTAFSTYQLCVFSHPEHPLAKQSIVTLQELISYPMLLREKGSAIRDMFDSMLYLHQLKLCPAWTSVNSQALIQGVKHNIGISVLPRILIAHELQEGILKELHMNIAMENCNYVAYHKDKALTKPLQDLISLCLHSD